MERSILKSVNNGLAKVSRVCLLSILFVTSFVSGSMAQSDSPSLQNLKNNTAAGGKELEKLRHDEFMSYVYMSVGFAIVIAIAWSTTVMARNRSRRQNEEKQRFILRQQELKKHQHGHSHSHGHVKARR